jgi:hypothetical protein
MPATKRRDRTRGAKHKVTYSLADAIVAQLEERAAGSGLAKSAMVSEALAFYFAEQDRKALAAVYAEAATDPLFAADNAQVLRDFAALDRDAEDGDR